MWSLLILFNTFYILNVPALHPARVGQVATLLIGVVGISTRREGVHSVLVSLIFLLWSIRAVLALPLGTLNSG